MVAVSIDTRYHDTEVPVPSMTRILAGVRRQRISDTLSIKYLGINSVSRVSRYHGIIGITIGYGSRGDWHAVTFGGILVSASIMAPTKAELER